MTPTVAVLLAYFAGMAVGVWAAWGTRRKGPMCEPPPRLKGRTRRVRGCNQERERAR